MNNRSLGTIFFLLIGIGVTAQTNIPSDTFRVVKEYRPILKESEKINVEPEIVDTLKVETELKYEFEGKQLPVSFTVDPIAAAKIKGEPLLKLYKGYARLGIGNAVTPMGEVYYSNLRSKKHVLGTHIKYLNQNEVNGMKGSEMNKFHAEVFGKRFWKRNTLSANLAFDAHNFNYYGFNRISRLIDANYTKPTLEQQYNNLNGQFSLISTKQDSFNLRHKAHLAYNMLSNKSGDVEHNVKVWGGVSQFYNSELYQIDAVVDNNSYDLGESNTILGLIPQISTIGDKFRANVGLGLYANMQDGSDFHFYPLAELKYNVIEDVLVPYFGVKGELKRNNLRSITKENPFVAENIRLSNSNEKYNIYLGIRGMFSKQISFNTNVARTKVEGDYLFVKNNANQLFLSERFNVVYDQIESTKLSGELAYREADKIKVYAQGEFAKYEAENQAKAWHRPELKISVGGEYNLEKKIIAKLNLFYWGEQYAPGKEVSVLTPNIMTVDTEEKLDPIFDANIEFEYRYTKRLSAFIQFNNLLGINYEKYQDYPLQGFNVFGGLSYSF